MEDLGPSLLRALSCLYTCVYAAGLGTLGASAWVQLRPHRPWSWEAVSLEWSSGRAVCWVLTVTPVPGHHARGDLATGLCGAGN